MRWQRTVTMVEAHAEGEVGRVVTGGVIDVPGATIADKLNHLNEVDDSLRRFLVFEPRGAAAMSTNLIFPPTRPDAADTTVAGRPAIVPTISGRGWIHGIHQVGWDPSDPYPNSYSVADTWGDAFDLLN